VKRLILAAVAAAFVLSSCWTSTPKHTVNNAGCVGTLWYYTIQVSAQSSLGSWRIVSTTHPGINGYSSNGSRYTSGSTQQAGITFSGNVYEGNESVKFTVGGYHDNPCRS
jgi:hypothetical protein